MRKLVAIGVLVATVALAASLIAVAAIRVSVSPSEGTPKTKFTVSFVVDRPVDGDRWLEVEVVSPTRQRFCESQESVSVTYAPKGRRVNVRLRPADRFEWCLGTYEGNIHVQRRTPCSLGPEYGACSTRGSTVGRFKFTVTP